MTSVKILPYSEINNIHVVVHEQTAMVVAHGLCHMTPAGLAVMIGQTLNTFGPVQTYEHLGTDAVGVSQPAAVLNPST